MQYYALLLCGWYGISNGGVVRRPVDDVIVMKVHENGDWLAQDDARPHYHIPDLTSEQTNGRQNTKGHLFGRGGGGGRGPNNVK